MLGDWIKSEEWKGVGICVLISYGFKLTEESFGMEGIGELSFDNRLC